MTFDVTPYKSLYPWQGHFLDVGRGVKLHYLDEGQGEPLGFALGAAARVVVEDVGGGNELRSEGPRHQISIG